MKPSLRVSIAAVVLSISSKKVVSVIYSNDTSGCASFHGNFEEKSFNVFGDDRSSCLSVEQTSSAQYFIIELRESASIDLQIDGDGFTGFDYQSSHPFSGRINGKSLSIFDCEDSQWHDFSCESPLF